MQRSRRELLAGGLALSMSTLTGCGTAATAPAIWSLKQSMPGSVLSQFRQEREMAIDIELLEDRQQLFRRLETLVDPPARSPWNPLNWVNQPRSRPVLSLLGADWLLRARAQDLIVPFTESEIEPFWSRLPGRWRVAARDREGQIWGIPWRWGLTAIAYNRHLIPEPLRDWSDLWRPELRGKLTLLDHPREVIGLTLKRLGRSYNAPLSEADPELERNLADLHEQVLLYTSEHYLQMLRTEDAWVAVGWSEDLFPLQSNFPNIEVVIPASGTAVWWDLWVKPQPADSLVSDRSSVVSAWLDWVLDPDLTQRIVNVSRIASVIPTATEPLSRHLKSRPDFARTIWERAEIWNSLSLQQASRYLSLWQQMRSGRLRSQN